MTTINSLLSGLNAASIRAVASANNIANARTTITRPLGESSSVSAGPYVPQDVIQVPQTTGGTLATLTTVDKPPLLAYEPDSGVVEYPNIDLAEELVKIEQASSDYKATLNAISQYQKMTGSLLDTLA